MGSSTVDSALKGHIRVHVQLNLCRLRRKSFACNAEISPRVYKNSMKNIMAPFLISNPTKLLYYQVQWCSTGCYALHSFFSFPEFVGPAEDGNSVIRNTLYCTLVIRVQGICLCTQKCGLHVTGTNVNSIRNVCLVVRMCMDTKLLYAFIFLYISPAPRGFPFEKDFVCFFSGL